MAVYERVASNYYIRIAQLGTTTRSSLNKKRSLHEPAITQIEKQFQGSLEKVHKSSLYRGIVNSNQGWKGVVQSLSEKTTRIMAACKRQLMVPLDLPDDLNLGRVTLRPLSGYCWRLRPCDLCRGHSARAYIGTCGHSFCGQCATLSLCSLYDGQSDLKLWCDICQRKEEADLRDVGKLLDRMEFECLCGFEGSLRQIKAHFWISPERGGHRAISQESAVVDTSTLTDQVGQRQVNTGKSIKDDRVSILREGIAGLVSDIEKLCVTGSAMATGILSLHASSGDQGAGMLWVPVKRLIEEYEATGKAACTPLYKWEANGFAIGSMFQVDMRDGSPWLSVMHRATFANVIKPWRAFDLCIRVSVRDQSGDVVELGYTPTFKEGKPVSIAFAKPLSDEHSGGFGVANLISIEHIQRPGVNIMTSHGLVNIQFDLVREE